MECVEDSVSVSEVQQLKQEEFYKLQSMRTVVRRALKKMQIWYSKVAGVLLCAGNSNYLVDNICPSVVK